jgi:glucose/arabinose dehydrogenase
MSKLRMTLLAVAGAVVLGSSAATAGAQGPPPPTAANGQPVSTIATGVPTPTSFALDPATGTLFVGAFGDEKTGAGGGVYALAPNATSATLVPGIPSGIAGVVFHSGTLYVSTLSQTGGSILALSQWNGTAFATTKTVLSPTDAFKTVGAINGLAWGPDGRLYGGAALNVDVNKRGVAKKSPYPFPYTVFSIAPTGGKLKIVSRGLRQPWQLTFPGNATSPYVTVLSQDKGRIPRDAIVVAKPGSDFGFPGCFLGVGMTCKGKSFAKPLVSLPIHSSPQGIGSTADTLYVALFGGLQPKTPIVASIPVAGGTPTPFLTGFVAPVVATNVFGGFVYAGDLTGSIYKVAIGS